MTKTNFGKEPAARKRTLFPILGAALLITCLFAGLVQAADTGIAQNENGNPVTGIALAFGETVLSANLTGQESPDTVCTSHTIACYDYTGKFLGKAGSGCHWNFWGCEDSNDHMLRNCRDKYGVTVEAAEDVTHCTWE